jgi:hypothetical protein
MAYEEAVPAGTESTIHLHYDSDEVTREGPTISEPKRLKNCARF